MSRVGDLENAIVSRLATATISGAPAFATVRGVSGRYRPALGAALRRERLPAAYVAFTSESIAPETFDYDRGARFAILIATRMLQAGQNPRHGNASTRGVFELMDTVRSRLDFYEPDNDVQLQCLYERFVDGDDSTVIYAIGYRAWPFFQQLASGDPLLAGPRVIGSSTDFIRFDPATPSYTFAGAARPTQRLPFHGPAGIIAYNVGSVVITQFATNADTVANIPAVQVTAASDGGWRSFPLVVPEWCDIGDEADLIVPVQAVAAATGDLSLRASWDIARDGAGGIIEGSVAGVVAGPTAAGDIQFVTVGTIPADTFGTGDCLGIAVQRLGASDAADTYSQDVLLARTGWLRFRRSGL